MTGSIGRAAREGLIWSLVAAISTRFGSLALGMVLARLLTPEDFGLYAVALSALHFVMHVNDVGLIAATVQWRGRLEDMAPTATTLALAFSVVIYGLFWVLAPAFAGLAGSPDAAPVLRVLTLVMLVDGVTAVRAAALLRTFRQRRITTANVLGLVANAAVAISLAAGGAGALSFAAGQVVGAVVIGAFVLWSACMPWELGYDRAVARRLLQFGVPLALALGVEAILLNADYIVVGRIAGGTALGFYLLAFNISGWAPAVLGTAIRWVSVPSFSRLSEEEGALAPAVHRSVVLLVTGVLPIGFLTAILGGPLIDVLYGAEWAPAGAVLRVLIVLGVVRMLTQLAIDVLTGAGATRAALWLNLAWVAVLVPALVVGTRAGGIQGTAVAQALVAALVAAPLAVGALRYLRVPLRPIAADLVRPLVAAGVGAACCVLVARLTARSDPLQLVAAGSVGLLAYAAIAPPPDLRRRWTRQALGRVPWPGGRGSRGARAATRSVRAPSPTTTPGRVVMKEPAVLSSSASPSAPPAVTMDLLSLVRMVVRQWRVTMVGGLLTLVGLVGVVQLSSPTYEATGSIVLLSPPEAPVAEAGPGEPVAPPEVGQNPFARYGDLSVVADIVVRLMDGNTMRAEFEALGVTDYDVAANAVQRGPVVDVTGQGPSPEVAIRSAETVLAEIDSSLAELQVAEGADPDYFVTSAPLEPPTKATALYGSTIRAAIAVLAVGGLATLALGVVAEVLARRRVAWEAAATRAAAGAGAAGNGHGGGATDARGAPADERRSASALADERRSASAPAEERRSTSASPEGNGAVWTAVDRSA